MNAKRLFDALAAVMDGLDNFPDPKDKDGGQPAGWHNSLVEARHALAEAEDAPEAVTLNDARDKLAAEFPDVTVTVQAESTRSVSGCVASWLHTDFTAYIHTEPLSVGRANTLEQAVQRAKDAAGAGDGSDEKAVAVAEEPA